jgi:RHS repeat-associated protein
MVYGSSRVGSYKVHQLLNGLPPSPGEPIRTNYADLQLELTDHLGTVRAVVTGQKDANNRAVIVSLQDVDAWGWTMQGRSFVSGSKYRFGYQGSENDQEYLGAAAYITEFRLLDVRIGRWLSTDPITHEWQSPYCSMDNDPINGTDVDGRKWTKLASGTYDLIKVGNGGSSVSGGSSGGGSATGGDNGIGFKLSRDVQNNPVDNQLGAGNVSSNNSSSNNLHNSNEFDDEKYNDDDNEDGDVETFYNLSQKNINGKKKLDGKIDEIISNHKKICEQKRITHKPICNDPDNYENQCAIRVSKAIQEAGIDMRDYPRNNVCIHGHSRDAGTLFGWIRSNSNRKKSNSSVYGTIVDFEDKNDFDNFIKKFSGRKGIVYFEIFGKAYHIDTFDGKSFSDKGYYEKGVKAFFYEIK